MPSTATLAGEGVVSVPEGRRVPRQDPFDDPALRKALRAGDRAAWGQLCRCYHDALLHRARLLLPLHHDVEDAVGEVWVKALRACRRYDPERHPHPWLATICVKTCLKTRRSWKRRRAMPLFGVSAGRSERTSDAAELRDVHNSLLLLLAGLKPLERRLITLRFLFGLSFDEIATTLAMGAETARKKAFRGLRRLEKSALGVRLRKELAGVTGGVE